MGLWPFVHPISAHLLVSTLFVTVLTMDERLKRLLHMVVEDVVETGEPVGSQRLVEVYHLEVSPATIRNWLGELEEQGYLIQPHTSSGRVPTEKGYRLYLSELMQERALHRRDMQNLQRAALLLSESAQHIRRLARMVAELSQDAVVLADPTRDAYSTGFSNLLSQPEFSSRERVVGIGSVLDRMDEILGGMRERRFEEPTALIGRDCPFGEDCGSIFLSLKDGTLLGLLGPMRMDYARGFTLLRAARDVLDE